MNFYTFCTTILLIIATFIILPIFKGFQYLLSLIWKAVSWIFMTALALMIGMYFQYQRLKKAVFVLDPVPVPSK
ncbi:hypothetical protein KMW28_04605 [Flammeovirga yaeyamensis]|uniref:Uncharacterized protein n=1 Tax=Flammeovirga yaeyamensis TaxID=367791 RepID=A0AAX1N5X7_9BACT|nr:hypothetical protein [Flammeovirga yaeyamensis]MBB3697438.1 putative membrane protein [Flammeovirga yaeyamensis]NMF36132.1 hypothetical protein [Flammeovirga yaeyamensis]QWG02865.1 hypothetical protein KMW28_04605 [Flammeovirga yaeyamensis]